MIVHECIHAIQDNVRAVWMTVATAEAAAYIGEMLFCYNRVAAPSPNAVDGVLFEAYLAAQRINQSADRNLRYDQIEDLLNAIRELRGPEADVATPLDGIRHVII